MTWVWKLECCSEFRESYVVGIVSAWRRRGLGSGLPFSNCPFCSPLPMADLMVSFAESILAFGTVNFERWGGGLGEEEEDGALM